LGDEVFIYLSSQRYHFRHCRSGAVQADAEYCSFRGLSRIGVCESSLYYRSIVRISGEDLDWSAIATSLEAATAWTEEASSHGPGVGHLWRQQPVLSGRWKLLFLRNLQRLDSAGSLKCRSQNSPVESTNRFGPYLYERSSSRLSFDLAQTIIRNWLCSMIALVSVLGSTPGSSNCRSKIQGKGRWRSTSKRN